MSDTTENIPTTSIVSACLAALQKKRRETEKKEEEEKEKKEVSCKILRDVDRVIALSECKEYLKRFSKRLKKGRLCRQFKLR